MKKKIKSLLFAFILPVLPVNALDIPIEDAEPVVILGGGVGSLTSAIYLGRSGLSPLVIEGPTPGGLLTQSHSVQNWPGELEIIGADLTDKMHAQAEANGARFLSEEVVAVDFSKRPFTITTRTLDGTDKITQMKAESCIIAMGTKPNFLKIPGEEKYWGKGVTNCAICDGSLYKDKVVGVVGGGDAAVVEALYLSNIAKEVHVFVRKDSLRAIEEKRAEMLQTKPNVKIVYNTTVEAIGGDEDGVTSVMIKTGEKGVQRKFPLDGLFLAIGSTPNSSIFQKALKLDDKGYILLEKDQQTSVNGIYAIGDIVDPVFKQAISAAGDGAKAALQSQQYLSDRINKLVVKKEPVKKAQPVISNKVIEIVSLEQFDEEIEGSSIPVFVDFYATWCGPCKKVAPILESAAQTHAGKVKFLKVNVDKFPSLSTTYDIKAMPTMLLIDPSGNVEERHVGLGEISDRLYQI